ncbi:MAG: hypothetical protein P8N05_05340 [Polaribacter sp.]|nr:hypothetical protein [Polaribacter sp.]MDG1452726.1 hypothetical protein [Polaribacter sp.]
MKIKSLLSSVVLLFLLLTVSCTNNNIKFKIEKGKVGNVTTKTTIQDLTTIFKKDSIVKNLSEGVQGNNYFQEDDEYFIFEKGGKLLLTILPKEQLDSTSTIKSIEIHDERFKTLSGISINSSFSEINVSNTIHKIERTFSSATLFLDNLNTTITIDNEELGLKEFSTQKVTKEQIPDLAKMKTFIVWFN